MFVVITKGVGMDRRKVFDGKLPVVPREGEHITLDDVALGHVHSVSYTLNSKNRGMTAHVYIR